MSTRFASARWALPFCIASGLVLNGAGLASAQQAEDWSKVVEAAKREGKMVIFSSLVHPAFTAAIDAFRAKYGIAVDVLIGKNPAEVRERIRVAVQSGKPSADAVFGSEALTTIRYNEDKTVEDVPSVPNAARQVSDFRTKAPIVPSITIPYGFLINTDLVKPEDEPKSWKDLLDPKWKGKILMHDPRSNGAGHIFFIATWNKLGQDYAKKLAAQDPTLTVTGQEANRRIARGEFPIYVGVGLTDILQLKGLPVKVVPPAEGCPYVLYGVSMVTDGAHPNAAKLFADFNTSDEAATIYARAGFSVGLEEVRSHAPADMKSIVECKLLGTTDPSGQDEALNNAKALYK